MGRAVFTAMVMFASVGVARGVWRYYTNIQERILFDTRNSINLEYEGDVFFQWIIPDSCTISSSSSPKAVLHCSKSGVHKIDILLKKKTPYDGPRYFYFEHAMFSFFWYMVKLPEAFRYSRIGSEDEKVNFVTRDVLRVWIVDPENISSKELAKKSKRPPLISRILTREFYSLGQDLILTTNPTFHTFKTEFRYESGYWRADIYNITQKVTLTISGKPVTFEDLLIKDSFYILENSGAKPERKIGGYLSLKLFPGRNPLVIKHPCSEGYELFVTEFGTFLTPDYFTSSVELKIVPTDVTPLDSQEVKTAAFLGKNTLFLVGDAIYIRYGGGFYFQLGPGNGLPVKGLIGLLGRQNCDATYPLKDKTKHLIAVLTWSQDAIYCGSKNATFIQFNPFQQALSVVNMPPQSKVTIVAMAFGSLPPEFSILVKAVYYDYKRLILVVINEEKNTWKVSSAFTRLVNDSLPAEPLKMIFVQSALSSIFIWNNNSIHYNLNLNRKSGKMHVKFNVDISQATEGSIIDQLLIDSKLNIIIKMSNNILLHGVVGSSELQRLQAWEKEDTKITMYLTNLDHIYFMKMKGLSINPSFYPLSIEAFSSALRTELQQCPFISFNHNKHLPIYYIDMGEEIKFWTQIIYRNNIGIHVEVFVLNEHLLEKFDTVQHKLHGKINVMNKTSTFLQSRDFKTVSNYTEALEASSGVLSLELQPSVVTNGCKLSSNMVSYISVGCPPEKHIRVKRDLPTKCSAESYTIPRGYVTESLIDIVVQYDMAKYGCPMQIHYKKNYQPTVLLYVGNNLIKKVDAYYIIWERYNRNDFSYNNTVEQSQKTCNGLSQDNTKTPQDTTKLIPCLELHSEKTRYMILNGSSNVFLTWATDHNALFLFHVKIVDPNFSFCNLTATFAIQTYGKIFRDDIDLVISLVWGFIAILLCMFGFSYYKYIDIFRNMLSNPEESQQNTAGH